MLTLPDDFDFKASAAHISLLDNFKRPTDAASIASPEWIAQLEARLGERIDHAVQRLERAGMLVECDAAESVAKVLSSDELQRRAREYNLPVGKRTKLQLALSLISADPAVGSEVTKGARYLKCSEEGLRAVASFEALQIEAGRQARQATYDALIDGNVQQAIEIVAAHRRRFDQYAYGFDEYRGDWLERRIQRTLHTHYPPSLPGLDPSSLSRLRAALCMPSLWRGELSERWVPQEISQAVGDLKRAMSHMAAAAQIAEEVERDGERKHRLCVRPDDVISCHLCRALDGSVFEKDAIPRLPLDGCTSTVGCRVHFEPVWEEYRRVYRVGKDEPEDETDDDGDERLLLSEDDAETDDAFGKLVELKKMLEHDLITTEEFQARKTAILDAWMPKKAPQN
jgi:hypothetical protein